MSSDALWPRYTGPDDLAAIEAVPLLDRGAPATTYDALQRAAALWPDRPATSFLPDGARYREPVTQTYAELSGSVHRVANLFVDLGAGRGSAVALLSPNCPGLLTAILAAEAVGIAAPINPGLSAHHARTLVELAAARILVAGGPELSEQTWARGRELAAAIGAAALLALRPVGAAGDGPELEPLPGTVVAYLDELAAAQPADRLVGGTPPAGSDIASYFHTGGTTGTPKLAAHTHANEVANAWMVAANGDLNQDSVLFAALPLFHVNALIVTGIAPLLRGQHVVWAGPLGYRDVQLYAHFWKLVEHHRIATLSGVPTVYATLAQIPVDADISTLRFAIVGAAPLPDAVRAAFESHTNVALCEGYGLTEATCATARSFPGARRPGSVGQRMPYQHLKAVAIDPDTGTWTDVESGRTGVIAISGPTVFPGYVVATADGPRPDPSGKVVDGWLDTGDNGRVDADGFLYLTGRAKDLIIRGGHNIDPAVIEDALLEHSAVAAASAVGRPDPHSGEVPVAYVTLAPGATADPDELRDWAQRHVPERAAAPKQVVVLDALPVTDVGKPFKPELRRDATQRAVRDEFAALGMHSVATRARAELADGVVRVIVPHVSGHDAAITETLGRYAFTWAFDEVPQ